MAGITLKFIIKSQRFWEDVYPRLCRPVQNHRGSALHGSGDAVSGPNAEPPGGSAQREEDAAVLPGDPAHGAPGSILGIRPAQDQDGYFPPQVSVKYAGFCFPVEIER